VESRAFGGKSDSDEATYQALEENAIDLWRRHESRTIVTDQMFNSNHRTARLADVLIIVLLVCCPSVCAQEQATTAQHLAWVQRFLWTFYPELKDHKYRMTTTAYLGFDEPVGDFGNFDITIGEAAPGTILGIGGTGSVLGAEPHKNPKISPIYAKQFLIANFAFYKTGQLFMFSCGGPATGNQEAYDNVKQLVNWHPEWTEAQAITALMKAGALYGPTEKEKFLKTLNIGQLDALFGKSTIDSVEFESGYENRNPPYALLHWTVKMTTSRADGDKRTYQMFFEPFKGVLTQIQAVEP
jgi:hypothetical protein